MNDYQEEKHNSNQLVVKVSLENLATIKRIPDFEAGINTLDSINKEVDNIRAQQEKDNSGVTENKHFTMKNLLNQTLEIAGAVYAYASKKNDILLMGKVDYKINKLSRVGPGKLISAASTTLEEAKKIPAEDLANAGITAAELTAYEEMVNYFKSISNSPREAQISTSVYTKQLAKLFKQSNQLFRHTLDQLARQFKTKAPEFYQKYRSARKSIKHSGTTPDATDKTKE